jgi:hypothetical protein
MLEVPETSGHGDVRDDDDLYPCPQPRAIRAAMPGLGPTQMGSPADVGQDLGVARVIATIRNGVTSALPADGAAMAAQAAGDLGITIALESHSVDDISLVHGKMAVRHREHSVV